MSDWNAKLLASICREGVESTSNTAADYESLPDFKYLAIRRMVRMMRGKSCAYLVEATDGNHYVAKFKGNPKGTRTLVNELLGAIILRELGLQTAQGVVLRLAEDSICEGDWPVVGNGSERQRAEAGLHFGSLYPGDPTSTSVYDFIPAKLNHLINNRDSVCLAHFVDLLLGRSEPRQAVFTRNVNREFELTFIDNSMLFGGSHWVLESRPDKARFLDASIYAGLEHISASREALSRIVQLLTTHRAVVLAQIPPEWIAGSEERLLSMLDELCRRAESLMSSLSYGSMDLTSTDRHPISVGSFRYCAAERSQVSDRKPVQYELDGGASKHSARLSASLVKGMAS